MQQFLIEHAWRSSPELSRSTQEKFSQLSNEHKAVLRLALQGRMNKVVASRLDVSERTIENRRREIQEIFGTSSILEIAAQVYQTIGPEHI